MSFLRVSRYLTGWNDADKHLKLLRNTALAQEHRESSKLEDRVSQSKWEEKGQLSFRLSLE